MKYLLFIPCSLFGLLSPFEESKREIIEILNSEKFASLTQEEAIQKIQKRKYGYLFSFPTLSIKATIESKKNDKISPPILDIKLKKIEKKKKS